MSLVSTIRILAAGALTALSIGAAAAQDLEKVTIQIDGAAVPYYLPMYVADHYGYFEEQGLEVEFLYANAADILNNIAVGNVQFGFPNGDGVIAAKASGLPRRRAALPRPPIWWARRTRSPAMAAPTTSSCR